MGGATWRHCCNSARDERGTYLNRRPSLALAFAAVVLATSASSLGAQERRDPTRVWGAIGLGSGAGGEVEDAGVALMIQLAWQKRPHQVLLRTAFLLDGGFPDGGSDGVSEIGLLYGRMRSAGFGHVGIATGLAAGTFRGCPGQHERTCHFVGIPIMAEAALSARVIGIGLQGFVNLNTRSVFGGVVFFVPIGWMP